MSLVSLVSLISQLVSWIQTDADASIPVQRRGHLRWKPIEAKLGYGRGFMSVKSVRELLRELVRYLIN